MCVEGGRRGNDIGDSQARLPPEETQQQRDGVKKRSPVRSQARAQMDGGRDDTVPWCC